MHYVLYWPVQMKRTISINFDTTAVWENDMFRVSFDGFSFL